MSKRIPGLLSAAALALALAFALGSAAARRRPADMRLTARDGAGRALAQRAQAIYAELDDRPLLLVPVTGGATDAAFAGRSGPAAVVENFGLAGFGHHARDEYVELDSIVPRLYLTTRLLTTL